MRAVRVNSFGDVDGLEVIEMPDPVPGEGEVRVRVKACGLNYADVMQREGLYLGGPKPPYFPGSEAAGVVEAIGPGVSSLAIGSRVAVIAAGGMHAECVVAKASSCLLLPDLVSFAEGAAFPVQYLTAYHALTTVAHAKEGETVLIHAAGGGFGTAAVQTAKLLGLKVASTASTADKRARVRVLGADIAVSYDEFEKAVREITRGRGPDIILETVGGDIFRRSLAVMPPLGRLVVIGVSSKKAEAVNLLKLLFRSQAVLGFHLSSVLGQPELIAASVARLLGWICARKLSIQIGHTLPLADIRKAHDLLSSRESFGKIVLIP
jgi:NADPH2:quinone reductase